MYFNDDAEGVPIRAHNRICIRPVYINAKKMFLVIVKIVDEALIIISFGTKLLMNIIGFFLPKKDIRNIVCALALLNSVTFKTVNSHAVASETFT